MKLHCRACGSEFPLESGRLACGCGRPLAKKGGLGSSHENRSAENAWSRFRDVLGSWHLAKAQGTTAAWEATLQRLDAGARRLAPRGLGPTPLARTDALATKLGLEPQALHAKGEFEFLMGSHKARHMIASGLYLESLGRALPPFAIFSCGNAALGAAAVANALGHPLFTFVPSTINPEVQGWLTHLGATVVKVRREGSVGEGDPCHNRYQEALDAFGWIPFSCYGHDNWAAVEGAEVMGLEFLEQMAAQDKGSRADVDALVVQVGGGGLAHGIANAVESALALGLLARRPRLYFVQTSSCFPLAESWLRLAKSLLPQGTVPGMVPGRTQVPSSQWRAVAEGLVEAAAAPEGHSFLHGAAQERERWFPAWSANVPESIAEGILDDTTYDGLEICEALFRSGGLPWVLSESELAEAERAVAAHGPANVSATGTSACAGVLALRRAGILGPTEKVGLLLTGVARRPAPPGPGVGRIVEVGPRDSLKAALGL